MESNTRRWFDYSYKRSKVTFTAEDEQGYSGIWLYASLAIKEYEENRVERTIRKQLHFICGKAEEWPMDKAPSYAKLMKEDTIELLVPESQFALIKKLYDEGNIAAFYQFGSIFTNKNVKQFK